MRKILVVEDDKKIARLEQDYLEINGYEVDIIHDGGLAVNAIIKGNYDLILLDLMLPNYDGYSICKEIREKVDVPILMVTARTEAMDVVLGLGLGADDYIVKPFDPAQLVARVKSHIKRYERLTKKKEEKEEVQTEGIIAVNGIEIRTNSWKVYKEGKEIKLPNREFELLRFLAENQNIVFSKEQLFEKIWGYDYESDAATVSVHINRIREKIETDSRNPQIIETVWGAGYRFNS
ncbi:response regulator transcription factor [Lachnospiraceae bacterium OttesenSCG-928-D06]|nr:response regulator transcription factor [Lachnospiraceae bacterium OttesenSCG-928-D06]